MKVAINAKALDGPWGGGNRFVQALTDALQRRGDAVTNRLDADADLVLMVDPRWRNPQVTFGAGAIARHLLRHPHSVAVHRINECDERKGEPFINAKLAKANYVADHTVFVGRWLADLPVWRQHLRPDWSVIRNGADAATFNADGFLPWNGAGRLRLVTHHWGYHPMKGFDIYAQLDAMLGETPWRERLEFTYVGNLPKGFAFRHARYVPPLNGAALAAELRGHHGYVTGSMNEPGGNHQNEGAMCGLPLLYRNSGCMPEYCAGFGTAFDGVADFPAALERYMAEYPALLERMPAWPHTAARMTAEWTGLFDALLTRRDKLSAARRLWRNPMALLRAQLPM